MHFSSTKKIRPRAGHYRISDIAAQVDRSITALRRWEIEGMMPKAKRDSRGWRIYTKKQVEEIIKLIKKTNYFSK